MNQRVLWLPVPDSRPIIQLAMGRRRCLLCGERISRGDKIARWPETGSVHLECLALHELKRGEDE